MFRRLGAVAAVAGLIVGGCGFAEGSTPNGAARSTAEEPPSRTDLAGELGPNGGVALGGAELETTRSLYLTQAQGGNALGGVRGHDAGLSVERDGGRLCLELHGLPVGENLLAASCDIPAYESHEDVEKTGWAYVSEVVIKGEHVRVVWGMTYLDATAVDLGVGGRSEVQESPWPYWMHRFFALPDDTGDATEVRLLDAGGAELAVLPLETRD